MAKPAGTRTDLTAIEAAALRYSAICAATDSYKEERPHCGVDLQANMARDFVLANEATTVTEAALQACILSSQLDILDCSTPITDEQQYEVRIRLLAIAAESVSKFLAELAGERFRDMTAGRWGMDDPYYRFPNCIRGIGGGK